MACARVEIQRLLFLARHQTVIRAELYQRLENALPDDAALEERTDGDGLRRRIILLASFMESPHFYKRQ